MNCIEGDLFECEVCKCVAVVLMAAAKCGYSKINPYLFDAVDGIEIIKEIKEINKVPNKNG